MNDPQSSVEIYDWVDVWMDSKFDEVVDYLSPHQTSKRQNFDHALAHQPFWNLGFQTNAKMANNNLNYIVS